MNKSGFYILLCVLLSNVSIFAEQWNDDFSNPQQSKLEWVGDWSQFAINRNNQLQSQSSDATESVLLHASTCAINAEWQFWTRISGACSAYNLLRYYIALCEEDIHADGYFVQIGGTNKNITLYEQKSNSITKLIEHPARTKILDTDASYVSIRVKRDDKGVLHLYSLIEGIDSTWIEEGFAFVPMLTSQYNAVYVKNTKTRGYDFYIDDIYVSGEQQHESLSQDEVEASVQLLSENISPNHDGWEDEVCIQYFVPNADYLATCAVYTSNGLLVKQIHQQTAIQQAGTICWNGTTDQGDIAEIGIYILYIELLNKKTHDTLRQRMVVSLTL